jgi:phospholipase D1/2
MYSSLKPHSPEMDSRTLGVIISKDGTANKAIGTGNLWVGVSPFSNHSESNKVKAFTTGKDYYSDLISTINSASESIYIAGWQVNWDAQLDEKGARLYDVLLNAAINNKKLKIYVMPWDDSAPIQTYDDQTKAVLELINKHEKVKRECVFVNLAKSMADADASFFSHHQKQVVIDNKYGYVGGIDLCYGRFDDANYDLHPDAAGRAALNRYNGCVAQTGVLDKKELVDPDLLTGLRDRAFGNRKDTITAIERTDKKVHQAPYAEDNPLSPMAPDALNYTLDEKKQPRMPWQDVHLKIEGPAVADLALNFVLRWNTEGGSPELKVPTSSYHLPKGKGSCSVQVLRSAPRRMCEAEFPLMQSTDQALIHKPIEAQANIAEAMETLINKADHFIYIENQFFVSEFGIPDQPVTPKTFSGPAALVHEKAKNGAAATCWMPGDSKQMPQNKICKLLADRVHHLIMSEPQDHSFHIYITLPVHPEGMLNEGPVITQVHWTMQSLVFGSQSLLNRIRRTLMAKKLGITDPNDKVYHDTDTQYLKIDLKDCERYVTLLNLRNHEKIGGNFVTEQIYIHSKMMIVDDRYALVGSANINDRSLMGGRDSELAVLISDTKTEEADLCGDGNTQIVRSFARQLRIDVWNKIFGITAGKRPATNLKDAVLKPAAPASWQAIREVAQKNTTLYEDAFDFIPRNKDSKGTIDKKSNAVYKASIWPRWHAPTENSKPWTQSGPMPFDKEFWATPQFTFNKTDGLNAIKGFITLLPIEWTKNENNNIGYHTAVVAMVEPDSKQQSEKMAANDQASTSKGA